MRAQAFGYHVWAIGIGVQSAGVSGIFELPGGGFRKEGQINK